MDAFFVKPRNELKATQMRAEICYRLVSVILSFDQSVGGNQPNSWKHFFSISATTYHLSSSMRGFLGLRLCLVSASTRPRLKIISIEITEIIFSVF